MFYKIAVGIELIPLTFVEFQRIKKLTRIFAAREITINSHRVCLVGLLLWLSRLISHKPNQTLNLPNALIAKAIGKVASRAKHARRCFSAVAALAFGYFPLCP